MTRNRNPQERGGEQGLRTLQCGFSTWKVCSRTWFATIFEGITDRILMQGRLLRAQRLLAFAGVEDRALEPVDIATLVEEVANTV